MDGWRSDPGWINASRAVFAVALAISVFIRPSSAVVQLLIAIAWVASALVLLWWTYKRREHERPAAAGGQSATDAPAPAAAWFATGGVLVVVGIVWAVAVQGWSILGGVAVGIVGIVVARGAGTRLTVGR